MVTKKVQAKRRAKISPGFGWVKPLLALATLAGSAIGLTMMLEWMRDPYHWPVQSVHIEGRFRHLQSAQLQDEVAPLASEGFFAMNVGRIQERIQQLPWVYQVSVRRVWPDQLSIRVREQQAIARWGDGAFLNPRAQVFEPRQAPELTGLPRFDGPEGYERRVLLMYKRMQDMLKELKLSVDSVRLDARRTWHVRLSNGLNMDIGRNDPIERIARFVRVYPAILAAGNGRVVSVDLRYSNGFAVHWQTLDKEAKGTG